MEQHDIAVIGGGPAGLAAALEIKKQGLSPVLIEREAHSGGILKQCIHEGFGLHRFKEQLTGPEYTERFLKEVKAEDIKLYVSTFVSEVRKEGTVFKLKLINSSGGVFYLYVKAIVLANGCRERTARQVFIHGERPAGILTAGTAQYYVNMQGYLPCKKCVILGSGDIGLIMARRLTLEGAEVIGVYEVKDTPSGLTRNVVQCLHDYDIPLHLSKTVSMVHGSDRVTGVTICSVDQHYAPVEGTEEYIPCDGVILSVGLIPENEIARSLGVELDPHTNGPHVNQYLMTNIPGVFSCGNALHVNDLVDYVSESGELAGRSAVSYIKNAYEPDESQPVAYDNSEFLYVLPQRIEGQQWGEGIFYFRSKVPMEKVTLKVFNNEEVVYKKRYAFLKPAEMEKIQFELGEDIKELSFKLEGDVS